MHSGTSQQLCDFDQKQKCWFYIYYVGFPLVLRVLYLILIEIISFLESRDYVWEDHRAKVQEGQKRDVAWYVPLSTSCGFNCNWYVSSRGWLTFYKLSGCLACSVSDLLITLSLSYFDTDFYFNSFPVSLLIKSKISICVNQRSLFLLFLTFRASSITGWHIETYAWHLWVIWSH